MREAILSDQVQKAEEMANKDDIAFLQVAIQPGSDCDQGQVVELLC